MVRTVRYKKRTLISFKKSQLLLREGAGLATGQIVPRMFDLAWMLERFGESFLDLLSSFIPRPRLSQTRFGEFRA